MSGRRRPWLWAVAVWAALVAVAGGLTLWLQDSAEPPGPYGREESSPTPELPEGWESMCPSPSPSPSTVACAFISSG
ncbi:hypothetical protein [Streptomyces sp. NRRL B-24085]|uniref:hypothetical protein n=1 Tax=Streptomyces sp. NRRL B-24085 TaxID=1709476 RepID=UPI00211B508E|nr:hypothetical protein [Streptomyces sp. NRRL B-24085]